MALSTKQYAAALYESIEQVAEKDHDLVIDNLVRVLKQNDDLGKFEAIVAEFEKLHEQRASTTHATVTTATPMKMNKDMMDNLNDMAGTKVEVKQETDESLIGGVVIRVGDTQLDASIKTQLDNLKKTLSH